MTGYERIGMAAGLFILLAFGVSVSIRGLPPAWDAASLAQTAAYGAGLWLPGLVFWFAAANARCRRCRSLATLSLFCLGLLLGSGGFLYRTSCGYDSTDPIMALLAGWTVGCIAGLVYAGATRAFFAVAGFRGLRW